MGKLWLILEILAKALGLWQGQKSEQSGAEKQRGEDAQRDLEDINRADGAVLDPSLRDPSGVHIDPNNRLRNKK